MDDLLSQIFAPIRLRPLAAPNALHDLQVEDRHGRDLARHNGEAWQQIANQPGVSRQPAWKKSKFAGSTEDVEDAYAKAGSPSVAHAGLWLSVLAVIRAQVAQLPLVPLETSFMACRLHAGASAASWPPSSCSAPFSSSYRPVACSVD